MRITHASNSITGIQERLRALQATIGRDRGSAPTTTAVKQWVDAENIKMIVEHGSVTLPRQWVCAHIAGRDERLLGFTEVLDVTGFVRNPTPGVDYANLVLAVDSSEHPHPLSSPHFLGMESVYNPHVVVDFVVSSSVNESQMRRTEHSTYPRFLHIPFFRERIASQDPAEVKKRVKMLDDPRGFDGIEVAVTPNAWIPRPEDLPWMAAAWEAGYHYIKGIV